MVQPATQVSPAHGGEMETDSSHRELPEDRPKPNPFPLQPAPNPPLKTHSSRQTDPVTWVELHETVRAYPGAARPVALDRYRRARKSSGRERRFKKGGVIDEAS
jgi:hypothetical protein